MQLKKIPFKKRLKRFLIIYGVTFIISWIALSLFIYFGRDRTVQQTWGILKDIAGNILSHPLYWSLLLVPYLLFALLRNLSLDFKRKGSKGLLKGIGLKIILPLLIITVFVKSLQHYRLSESFDYAWDASADNTSNYVRNLGCMDTKQRGIHTFNISSNLNDLEQLKTANFEWITLTPFIWQRQYNSPEVGIPSSDRFQETRKRYARIKEECHSFGIQIMLKPHIWMRENVPGKWRSNIQMTDAKSWNLWFDNYEKTMLMYAELAEELGFEQFCVGTELESTVREHPEKWLAFIAKVKKVYSGTLTYAANWNKEYQEIPFWNELDYIGIQAYFPLSDGGGPTLDQLENAWQPFMTDMEEISKRFNKPILFTEMGYRSLKGTSQIPWEWGSVSHWFSKISTREQYLCYEAFFNTVWQQPWFAGIHIWEWQGSSSHGEDTSFTIEYKPAMNLVTQRFYNP